LDSFESYVRAGLELRGIDVDDTDIAVMRAADAVYGPAIRSLMEADLGSAAPEIPLDPGRPPQQIGEP
jgi:hypothetical protein